MDTVAPTPCRTRRGAMQGEQTSSSAGPPSVSITVEDRKAVRANPPRRRPSPLLVRQQSGAQGHRSLDPRAPGHRAHRSVGLRQEHLPALLQPDARSAARDPLPGLDHAAARRHQSGRRGRGSDRGADADRHGLPEAESLSEDRVRERRLRTPAARGTQPDRPRGTGRRRAARRGDLGRGQGPAVGFGARALRRPDAAPLHRGHSRRSQDTAVRRADVGARPDRDREDRGTHLGAPPA